MAHDSLVARLRPRGKWDTGVVASGPECGDNSVNSKSPSAAGWPGAPVGFRQLLWMRVVINDELTTGRAHNRCFLSRGIGRYKCGIAGGIAGGGTRAGAGRSSHEFLQGPRKLGGRTANDNTAGSGSSLRGEW